MKFLSVLVKLEHYTILPPCNKSAAPYTIRVSNLPKEGEK